MELLVTSQQCSVRSKCFYEVTTRALLFRGFSTLLTSTKSCKFTLNKMDLMMRKVTTIQCLVKMSILPQYLEEHIGQAILAITLKCVKFVENKFGCLDNLDKLPWGFSVLMSRGLSALPPMGFPVMLP